MIYLAGPISGAIAENQKVFDDVRKEFHRIGVAQVRDIISPVDIGEALESMWHRANSKHMQMFFPPLPPLTDHDYMLACLRKIAEFGHLIHAIVPLPGWEKSTGASLECAIAKVFGWDWLDHRTGVLLSTPPVITISQTYGPRPRT